MPGSPLDQWMAMAELYRTMMGTPGGPGAPANGTHGHGMHGTDGHPACLPVPPLEGLPHRTSPA